MKHAKLYEYELRLLSFKTYICRKRDIKIKNGYVYAWVTTHKYIQTTHKLALSAARDYKQ